MDNYKNRLHKAFKEGEKLGLSPKLGVFTRNHLLESEQLVYQLHSDFTEIFNSIDWADNCLNFAAQSYMAFRAQGIPCEIVFGDVYLFGNIYEFQASLKGLKKEYKRGFRDSGMNVHAWLALGDDFILDFAMPARFRKKHDPAMDSNGIIFSTPGDLVEAGFNYLPMLAGAKFLDRTCGIDIEEAVKITASKSSNRSS